MFVEGLSRYVRIRGVAVEQNPTTDEMGLEELL